MQTSTGILPVEIKSSATFSKSFIKGIEHFRKVSPSVSEHGYVLYNGDDHLTVKNIQIGNYLQGLKIRMNSSGPE